MKSKENRKFKLTGLYKKGILLSSVLIVGLFLSHFTFAKENESDVITNADIEEYMLMHGYQVFRIGILNAEGDRMVDTQYSYDTKVFVSGDAIVGHEDIYF